MDRPPKPLYRKVNTRTWGVRHSLGRKFKHSRNKKRENKENIKGSMHGSKLHGLDYTPLYMFLVSKVGASWDQVYSEAKSRLPTTDPIYHIVARAESDRKDFIRVGESTYFFGLYIDDEGILKKRNVDLKPLNMMPFCECCTHTFNGIPFGQE